MATPAHLAQVRSLYKRILVLHRFLPIDLKALGDRYVRDEFRRHKKAAKEEVASFLKEWQVKNRRTENRPEKGGEDPLLRQPGSADLCLRNGGNELRFHLKRHQTRAHDNKQL